MSQCVPSWDIQENPSANKLSLRSNSNSQSHDVLMLDYEVAELTWENGQLAMHGLGPPRVSSKHTTWDKPRASGTLESIVNQATRLPDKPSFTNTDDLVPWFDPNRAPASATMAMDAMVPCANQNDNHTAGTATRALDSMPGLGTCMVGSCSVAPTTQETQKRARVTRAPVAPEWSGKDQSVGASASVGRDSQQMTLDTYDKDFGVGLTSTSLGSLENTSSGGKRRMTTTATTADDHDSVCHSRPQRDAEDGDNKKEAGKSSVSTKRSRAAAIHNQSERKRRDKINQRMKTLQKLVPNSSKTDKASMLDEVIEYMKQLQAQVQMMQRMNMPAAMMLPMAMQQQLQMSMMAPMGMMGMGMGVMDMNSIARPNIPSMSPFLNPSAFMPMASCDGSNDRLPANPMPSMPDPLSAFLACQSQPMNMDAYKRMAAMYQQHLQPPSNSKN